MKFLEIVQLLKTATAIEELDSIRRKLLELFPWCAVMVGYERKRPTYMYDFREHSLHTVLNLPRDMEDNMLYLAAFLHDVGKPDCRSDNGPSHPEKSVGIVQNKVIPSLAEKGIALTSEEQRRLLYYVRYHDDWFSLRQGHLQRHLKIASLSEFRNLMLLQIADAKAHNDLPIVRKRIGIYKMWLLLIDNAREKSRLV